VSLNEKEKLKVLSLFAGIGGIDLGLESTGRFETIQFVEYEPFCQHILRRHWPDVPIWGDVKTFDPDSCGDIDLICGGYPCQPFSVAGKQKGTEDDRHLWPRMFEIIKHKRPTWVLCENVPGHVNLGLDQVLFDLESEGYSWQTFVLGAVAVDAPHRRQRLFIVGYSNNNESFTSRNISSVQGEQNEQTKKKQQFAGTSGYGHSTDVANTDNKGLRTRIGRANAYNEKDGRGRKDNRGRSTRNDERNNIATTKNENLDVSDTISKRGCSGQTGNQDAEDVGEQPRGKEHGEGSIERGLGGMVDGVPSWLHEPDIPRVTTNQVGRTQRLKALGNAVVPQVIAQIARAIIIEEDR
tara:strand:+ start:61 stop:1119 length:1059 start_codon:yes stop_codon:yes gene_type:complete